MRALRALGDLQASSDGALEPAAGLLMEGAALHLVADLKWLDRCEERLVKET